jgi:hypothetical protein
VFHDARQLGVVTTTPAGATATARALAVAHVPDVGPERRDVVVEAERSIAQMTSDSRAVVALAPHVGLAGDEADELRNALLDQLPGVIGDPGLGREHPSHHANQACDRDQPALLADRQLWHRHRLRLGSAASMEMMGSLIVKE